jgi:hypothetical protein
MLVRLPFVVLALGASALMAPSARAAVGADEARRSGCASTEGEEPGPRLEEWVRKRQAKCQELAPYRTTWLERQILSFEKAEQPSITQINLLGLYPRIQTIDHRSQWAGGVRLWQPELGGSGLDLHGGAFVSLGAFQFYDLQFGVIPHKDRSFPLFASKADQVFELANVPREANHRYMAYGAFTHRYAPKYDFFGIGPDSQQERQADYLQTDYLYEGVVGYRIWPRFTLAARAGYYHVRFGPGKDDDLPNIEDVFAPSEVSGLRVHPPDFVRYGASATFDSRDVPKNPHQGVVAAAEWQHYDEQDVGDLASFNRYAADARAYISLGHPQRVLVLRAYGSKDDPFRRGGQVPFYMMQFLGSSHTLRAFDSQRFRGEKLVLVQAEYRWEASPALELAAFVDSGTVAAKTDDSFGRFETDGGFGLRFKTHEALLLRLDFAWGGEGFKFLVRFSPSF